LSKLLESDLSYFEMAGMDQARRDKAIKELVAKKANRPCPRCGGVNFSIAGEAMISLQANPNTVVIGGPVIPVVLVACESCGYIMQHAQAALGLMGGGQ